MTDDSLTKAKQRLARYLKNRTSDRSARDAAQKRLDEDNRLIKNVRKVIGRLSKPVGKQAWNPAAKRVPYTDVGAFINVPAKLVWHTTEGSSLPTYSGSAPHFTLNPKTGELWQHIAVNRTAMSLEHPAGTVETNRAHAIQVELIGFAKDTGSWPDSYYARIAKLARWIEANTGVSRKCSLTFSNTPNRLTDGAWLGYNGHCGHQHVPNNHHWDPGALLIAKVLA